MSQINNHNIEVSVIIAVYNHWRWLEMILTALNNQTFRNFEIIIADDGSNDEIAAKLAKWQSDNEIVHVWHEDIGWRKNIILNKATEKARGEYLIFLDGDCVPHKKWIADHLALRKRGEILSGRRVDLPRRVSDNLTAGQLDKRFSSLSLIPQIFSGALKEKGISKMRWMRFPFPKFIPLLKRSKNVLGCNFSLYRQDLLQVNGFDERYLHPGTGEDTDLEARLRNAGFAVRVFSHYMIIYHRNHNRLDMSNSENKAILAENISKNVSYTPYGINKTKKE